MPAIVRLSFIYVSNMYFGLSPYTVYVLFIRNIYTKEARSLLQINDRRKVDGQPITIIPSPTLQVW
jgi:hypothetical protein